jgi:type IV secretion system protein TrbE
MMRTRRIRREYGAAGSLNALIALWGFLGDDTFLTKAGDLGLVYRIGGVDFECLDHTGRREVAHRFGAALRGLDESYRVYQYVCKRRMAPIAPAACRLAAADEALRRRAAFLNERRHELFELDLYLVLQSEHLRTNRAARRPWQDAIRTPQTTLRDWLVGDASCALVSADLDRAFAQLHQRAAAFEAQLADSIRPTRLGKADAFRFFRRLVNYSPRIAEVETRLQADTHLDYFIADSSLDCHRDHLQLDSTHVKALTMKEPPGATYPHVLEGLYTVPAEFIACLEWRRLPADRVRRMLRTRQRHFFNARISMVNYVSPATRPEEMLVDESATATVRQLGDALTDLEVHGHSFGECSLSIVLFGEDPQAVDRSVADALKVMAVHDGAFIPETYNLLNAWLALLPGNGAYNLRRLPILDTNCADLSFLFTLDTGGRRSTLLDGDALGVFETRYGTPYFFDPHVEDVGHCLMLGATGSGKSFLANFLVLHAQQYDPLTAIFDIGGGYRQLAAFLEAGYLTLGVEGSAVSINPFAFDATPAHLHFLQRFARVLLEGRDGYRLSEPEDRELYLAIENVYALDPDQRRLLSLANLLPRALSGRLARWVEGGRYGQLFDHVEDTFSLQPCQVLDFSAMQAYPELLEALLFYVLHRLGTRITDASSAVRLKLCLLDEAWRFIQHEALREYVEAALKTWRKHKAAMWLATQSVDDFTSANLLRTVVEGCPTRLLLANPSFDRGQYAALFGLNAVELDSLAALIPRRELLLKRPGVAKVLALNVDRRSYWLYTNTPRDNERARAAFAAYGFAEGLERLAATA